MILWLKALHIIFMVAWFAGIFYLPRLFVYHAQVSDDNTSEQLKIMERRLLYFVTPFAVLTLAFGLALMWIYGAAWLKASVWLHVKLVLVTLLYVYHGYCFKLLADFKHNRNTRSHKFYRVFNEVPVLALFAIIILAVVKPF
ncbi:protoporphyrinogen oxidase HemJ [Pseudidiomarina donghaiensis]|jgi:putative membrane protein|uniref:Protoporphyrinogen IX oxidase n=1 Tax=Pseudidiomarina donghaiensis TaxID=519452 RepID=A0A432XFT1_9GAMM|nr:protoporphyrinogen oxidase HemJ [Pseudidiomarina donghaiensis]MBR9907828.1 protoporphyrinogen oxidase HemJ [Gammaproteobacteria bacterium]RUO47417.1 protoporphyrinogen oxidase HemJ [Pseudidiomarina donghaiensis]SFV23001.1 putative membrane protein [Pseudidiomarina donghaiensis]